MTTADVLYRANQHNLIVHFFFQAEDGIRDGRVTGVQTCALPISQAKEQERGRMLLLNGSVLPHQRRGRLGHFRLCGRIITNASNLPTSRNDMLTLLCDGVFLTRRELTEDPIMRSWVSTGADVAGQTPRAEAGCQFCPDSSTSSQQITSMAGIDGDPWSARAVVHPNPLYRIEGEPARRGEGIYDRMRSVGAHEVLLENPRHDL